MEGPVKYMLLICRDEPAWDKLGVTERQQVYAEMLKLSEELIVLTVRKLRAVEDVILVRRPVKRFPQPGRSGRRIRVARR